MEESEIIENEKDGILMPELEFELGDTCQVVFTFNTEPIFVYRGIYLREDNKFCFVNIKKDKNIYEELIFAIDDKQYTVGCKMVFTEKRIIIINVYSSTRLSDSVYLSDY